MKRPVPKAWVVAWIGAVLLVGTSAPARAVYLNLPHFWLQCDSQWENDQLGTCATDMCAEGCAVTSTAMVFAYYGGTDNPGQLNQCLTNNGGYANGCWIYWDNNCFPPGVTYGGWDTESAINGELNAGRPVIAEVNNASIGMHFVVIVGNDNGQLQILDPYWPQYQTIADGNYNIVSIRKYDGNVANPCTVVVTNAGETVIDDDNACFMRHGSYWWSSAAGLGGHHYYTYAIDDPNPDCWAEWRFEVADAGDYDVHVHIPDAEADTQHARYTVDFGSGTTDVTVDQAAASGWTSLGTFTFTAGADRSIALFDNTGEPLSANIPIGFDAVRLSPATASDPDAGVGPDAATGSDAGPAADGAASDDASGTGPGDAGGGCGCRTGESPALPVLLLVLGLLGILRRRR